MRTYSPEIQTAIEQGVVMPREFLEIHARDRGDSSIHYERLWSDGYDITADVLDPDDGSTLTLDWQGAAGLVDIDPLPRVANLTVPRISIQMLAVGADIDRIIRTYDVRQAPVRLWRGYLDASSRKMVAPAELRFIGFVDEVDFPTGAEGSEAYVTLSCVSHSQEMTRSSTETRSHESQLRRNATDDFFKSAATVGDWVLFWGTKSGKVETQSIGKLPTGAI